MQTMSRSEKEFYWRRQLADARKCLRALRAHHLLDDALFSQMRHDLAVVDPFAVSEL